MVEDRCLTSGSKTAVWPVLGQPLSVQWWKTAVWLVFHRPLCDQCFKDRFLTSSWKTAVWLPQTAIWPAFQRPLFDQSSTDCHLTNISKRSLTSYGRPLFDQYSADRCLTILSMLHHQRCAATRLICCLSVSTPRPCDTKTTLWLLFPYWLTDVVQISILYAVSLSEPPEHVTQRPLFDHSYQTD